MFRLRVVSLISKNQRCSTASVDPKIASSPLTAKKTRPVKTTEVTFLRKVDYGPMQKLFSSIAWYFSGMKCLGVDQADNSYYTVSGERWVVFKDDDEISIPVEWIHWLSWKRMEAPTRKETIEQQATRKVILPSREKLTLIDRTSFYYFFNAMCLSRDGKFLRVDVNLYLPWEGGISFLFSVEKRLIQNGDVRISSEADICFFIVDSFEQLIDGLASKTNPLISDKFEEESGAQQGMRSFEDTEDVNDTYDFIYLTETSIFNYISNIFRFQLSRANRFGDLNGCAPRKFNSQGA